MFKFTFRRLCAVSTLAVMGMVASVSANHSWGNYHWAREANPLTLKIGDNVSGAWDEALTLAEADWDSGWGGVADVLSLSVVPGSSTKNCRPTAGRIEVCNGRYGNNGWLGIAQIWITDGTHITQGVTKVNDTYFNTATYNKPEWRHFVMCQEIGHDFGLDHQDETFNNANLGSCMDYTNNPLGPLDNEHPNQHDFQQLASIYGHTDDTTTSGATKLPSAMPPAMGQIDFDAPGQWGRLVSRSRGGRDETYELDFGRGNKVVTHVIWADPDADAR